MSYPAQAKRLESYITRFFNEADNLIRYDATGVGDAAGDLFTELDLDAGFEGVVFTNKSKSEMVTRSIVAIEDNWHKAPPIQTIEDEFTSYELTITKTGLHSYAAEAGGHDDVVSAAILAISAQFSSSKADATERLLEEMISGTKDDNISAYANIATDIDDEFFDAVDNDDEFAFDLEEA